MALTVATLYKDLHRLDQIAKVNYQKQIESLGESVTEPRPKLRPALVRRRRVPAPPASGGGVPTKPAPVGRTYNIANFQATLEVGFSKGINVGSNGKINSPEILETLLLALANLVSNA